MHHTRTTEIISYMPKGTMTLGYKLNHHSI